MSPLLTTLLLSALATASEPRPAGAASHHLGDFDGDGRQDLFVCGLAGEGRLLRNLGRGEFVDLTVESGILAPGARSAHWQDVDGDGDLDLVVLADRRPLALWTNLGGGLFADQTVEAGLASEELDLELRFVDLDGEGGLDLLRRSASGERLYLNRAGRFQPLVLALPGAGAAGGPSLPVGSGLAIECIKAIMDLANPGNCITASTVPVLGMLYPLSVNWFVDGSGRVGIGTLTPSQKLEVVGNVRASGQLQALTVGLPPLVVNSSFKVTNLNADQLDGLDSSAFSQLGNSIEGSEITDGTVGSADLATWCVTTDKISNGAVGSVALGTSAVSTEKIAFGAVTSSKLAGDAVSTGTIQDGAVTAVKLADSAVTSAKIQSAAVSTAKLQDASVTAAKLAAGAVGGAAVLDGSLTGADIAANSVDGSRIANGTIAYTKLASPLAGTSSGPILWVDNNTTGTQGMGIYAETSASGDPAIEANALSTGSGVTYGLKALSASAGGYGVWARANHGTGPNFGVMGETNSTAGIGVLGRNNATSGADAHGVVGTTASTSGRGLSGTASATSGANSGVFGETSSAAGIGVIGINWATSGVATAVYGGVSAAGGRALYGRNTATTGTADGVRGYSASPVGYGVYASGNLGASGVKSFVQPHPIDPTKEIRFVCLEGNESGTYFRGRARVVDGRVVVSVPEDFRLVSESEELSCQLTVAGAPALAWVESLDLEQLVLRASADVELHYVVHGIRRGFAGFETIRPNTSFVPELAGRPYGTQYPEAFRRILVQNGTLNADFTPNEATASALGRTLSADGERAE